MKKILIMLLLVMCVLPGNATADIVEKPVFFGYVYDYANVISASNEILMNQYCSVADSTKAAQVITVTVDTLSGMDIADYATEVINQWGIGDTVLNNGIVILLAPNERMIQIATGNGIDNQITGDDCGHLLDKYAIDYLAKNDFSEGLLLLSKAVCLEAVIKSVPLFDDAELLSELLEMIN